MKTLIKLIAAIVIINLTACKDDIIPEPGSIVEEDQVGEELPPVHKDGAKGNKERVFSDKDKIRGRENDEVVQIKVYEELKDRRNTSRSKGVEGITFGNAVYSTTVGQGNSISQKFGHPGEDRVYKLGITQTSEIELMLKDLHTDLDLYIAEVLNDAYGRELVGNLIGVSENYSVDEELIRISVEAGDYFIIVDSYDQSGPFTLTAKDVSIGGPDTFCEDYEKLVPTTDIYNGVSRQLTTWNKWSPNSVDGLILYEDYSYSKKVVKFDYGRFHGQDAVRTLIGLPITSGLYTMDFKIYIPHSYAATFLTEKKMETGKYISEQGFKIHVDNDGTLEFEQRGITKTSRVRIPQGEWVDVNMIFDLENNTHYVIINHSVLVLFSASAPLNDRGNYIKSISGIDFYVTKHDEKFHVDDVCVSEVESGYEQPIMQFCYAPYEEEISFIEE